MDNQEIERLNDIARRIARTPYLEIPWQSDREELRKLILDALVVETRIKQLEAAMAPTPPDRGT